MEGLRDSIRLKQYIDFNRDFLAERGRLAALLRVVGLFYRFSRAYGSLDEVIEHFKSNGAEDLHLVLQRVVNELREEGLAPKTIRFYLWFLYSFLRFFDIDVERVKGKIRLPKKAKIRDDRGLRLSEIQRIILASKSPRMRTLLHLLAATGLRINEARLLKVDNIDFENRVLRVPGSITKSGRPREIPLTREVAEVLKNYLKRREVDSEWLFPSKEDPSKPVNRYKLYRGFYRILRSIGLNKRDSSGIGYQIHFHSFRKWFKTTLERAGVNRLLIEKWLGHDLGVQGDYFTPSPDYIEEEWEKAEKALTIFGRREPEEELKRRDGLLKEMREFLDKHEEGLKEVKKRLDMLTRIVESVLDELPYEEQVKIERIARKYLG